MLRQRLHNFFFRSNRSAAVSAATAPHGVEQKKHNLSRSDISPGALQVVEQLTGAGFSVYVVGGCVRDLLLGLHPKDFDVATDATPEQVVKICRRSRIIGRRFRIVHVRYGREIVEVTTFRAQHEEGGHMGAELSRKSDQGLLLRDNVFGSIEEDARRRDFTVNALYYNPSDNSLYDYANGMADIKARVLRIIGDPATRYREDPVRMLRACRFAAKLGFSIDPATAQPLFDLGHLLGEVAAARLYDEVLKLFMNGQALATYRFLDQYGLFLQLFPVNAASFGKDQTFNRNFVEQALVNTDKRVRNGQRVTPAFLLAALLWPALCAARDRLIARGETPIYATQQAANEVVTAQLNRITMPRRFTLPMREIWDLQLRLPNRTGNRASRLVELPRFRAGYDFLLLREEVGEDLNGLGRWWTKYQEANADVRQTLVNEVAPAGTGRPRRGRRRSKNPDHKNTNPSNSNPSNSNP